MKVVFDTNIYISGLIFKGGIPSRLMELAQDRKFSLFFSPHILEEIRAVTRLKFDLNLNERDRLIRWVESLGQVVYPSRTVKVVKSDDPDNRILECALEAEADYLVTGDKKHLLSLKQEFSFKIIAPAEFYRVIS